MVCLFFLRYWREYIVQESTKYLLTSNFVSSNAYMCVELNAHALIIFIVTLRDKNQSASFLPWLLGSQCCEKTFRAAQSMTSTFSTIINFSMLGLLRRLHRLEIQIQLESEENSEVVYPRTEQHRKKDGHMKQIQYDLTSITDNQIQEAVIKGKIRAKEAMEALGMKEILEKAKFFDNPPIPEQKDNKESTEKERDLQDENEKEEEEDNDEIEIKEDDLDLEIYGSEDLMQNTVDDVKKLTDNDIIDKQLSQTLINRGTKLSRTADNCQLPMYMCNQASTDNTDNAATKTYHDTGTKHSPFVPVQHNGKQLFIRKSTAVWLFSEGERISADRLFRVRNKQPFSESTKKILEATASEIVCIGDVCAFHIPKDCRIGRVLHFSYYKETTKKGS